MKTGQKYFSYDPNDGFAFYDSEEKAKAACYKSFEYYEDEAACDGWPENTGDVCWGVVVERSTLTKQIDRPPKEELDEEGYDGNGVNWSDPEHTSFEQWEIKPACTVEEER